MQQPTHPVGRIKRAHNPRKFFDPAKMIEMRASVAAVGVLQPIVVRPIVEPDFDLEVIIGGRRHWAASEELGPDYEMPIVVKDVGDAEARAMAVIENIQRADMAPSEEAVAAAELVGMHKGDRDEVARIFGWSRSRLDARLALMNCSDVVLEALNTRQILLGHAELLAALSKEIQDKVLPTIVAEKSPIAEVRRLVEGVSCLLAQAIFDKTECAGCQHNSSRQAQMFGEAIGAGNCTNPTCFKEKSERALDSTVAGLREEFQVVRIVRAGDNHTRVQLAVDGPKGVGLEQAKACHACANYGAAVSALPDSTGKVYRGQCFDTVCNMKMVGKRIQQEKAASEPAKAGGDNAKPAAKGTAGSSAVSSTNPSVTVITESERVKAYRVRLWRKALRADIGMSHELARQYLIAIVLSGYARQISDGMFRKLFERITDGEAPVSNLPKAVEAVQATDEAAQANLMIGMLFSAIDGLEVTYLTQLCKTHKLDLKKHWKLDKEFLELITKSEMMVLADELGIRAALGDSFKKVFAKSKAEVVEALLAVEGFDYAGKLPKVLRF